MNLSLSLISLALASSHNVSGAIEHIEVSGQHQLPSASSELIGANIELNGAQLNELKAPTLGDTLDTLPGVSASHFGPSASRPQLRGFGAQRVVLATNAMAVRDMSSISADQLVPIEPFFADNIRVIKGATAVIPFGGEAMAGVVDVDDSRIPKQLSAWQAQEKVELQSGYNSASSLLAQTQGQQQGFAFNANILVRQRGDYKVPDSAKAPVCASWSELVTDVRLADHCQVKLASPQWQFNGEKWVDITPIDEQIISHYGLNDQGKVSNSSSYQTSGSIGGSQLLSEHQELGFAYSFGKANRGIPGFMHLGSATAPKVGQAADIRIYSSFHRVDGRYSQHFNTQSYLDYLEINGFYSQQRDDETLAGTSVNLFEVDALQLNPRIGFTWHDQAPASIGLQIERSEHRGEGSDNYLPEIEGKREALYLLQNLHLQALQLQFGARYDHIQYKPNLEGSYVPGRGQGANVQEREFHLQNYSVSMNYHPVPMWSLRASYTDAQRAPAINELYASNPHLALLIEEQGNTHLNVEQNRALEWGTRVTLGDLQLAATWFDNEYTDFTYLGNTGVNRGGVYVQEWRQADTDNQGYEITLDYSYTFTDWGVITLSAFTDSVKNTPRYQFDGSYDPFELDNFLNPDKAQEAEYWRRTMEGDSIPKTPANRTGLKLGWQYDGLRFTVNYTHHDKQQNVGKHERPSSSYVLLGFDASVVQPWLGDSGELFVNIDNITDEDARAHQSYLRFIAPLPGRSIALGLRARF